MGVSGTQTFAFRCFSGRKNTHANTLTFHQVYIQGDHSPIRFITMSACDWCVFKVFIHRSVESDASSETVRRVRGYREAHSNISRATVHITHLEVTVLPNHGLQYRKLKAHRHYPTGSYTVRNEQNSFCFPSSDKIHVTTTATQKSASTQAAGHKKREDTTLCHCVGN